ncbi:MAG: putative metallophosphoesterase YhaO [Firmicutes bacterium]|nr:putative metallophosphoesterase YhaO [Bacillota bacterium]MBT9158062.1 putative metallophosphoesterase YhaO [Bacillota bacterium]
MITLLHLSDLHLGWQPKFLGAKAAERAEERNQLLKKAVALALNPNYQVDAVIIAGDLFEHHNPEARLVEEVLQQLNHLTRQGKLLLTVPGNHDEISYRDSVYRLYADRWPGLLVTAPEPSHVGSRVIRGEAIHFYSVAYTGGITKCDAPLSNLPRLDSAGFHVGVFHGSLDCPVTWRSLPLASNSLAMAKYDYIALGHFHQAKAERVGFGVAAYCGATMPKGFDDLGTGVVQLVELSAGRVELRTVPILSRPQKLVEISLDGLTEADINGYLARMKDEQAIVRLVLSGTAAPGVQSAKVAAYAQGLFYHCEVVDNSDEFSVSYLEEVGKEMSVRGFFVKGLLTKAMGATLAEEKEELFLAIRRGLRAFKGGQ